MMGQLEERLQKLKAEFESGQNMLADVEARQTELQKTLLRISGAIQVLEELLSELDQPVDEGTTPAVKNPAEVGTAA